MQTNGRVLHNGQQLSRLRNARVLFRRSQPDHSDLDRTDIHSRRVNFQIADNPHGAGGFDTMRGISDAKLFVPGAPGILLSRRDYRSGDTDGGDDRLRHTVHQQLPRKAKDTRPRGFARRGVFQLHAHYFDLVVDTVFRNADNRAYGKGPVYGPGVSCDSDRQLLCGGALRDSSARNFGGAGQAYMLQREKVGRIKRQAERKVL